MLLPPDTLPLHYSRPIPITLPFSQHIMSLFQQKIIRHSKRQNTQIEENEQVSGPGSEMAEMLELSDQELFLKNYALYAKDFNRKDIQQCKDIWIM